MTIKCQRESDEFRGHLRSKKMRNLRSSNRQKAIPPPIEVPPSNGSSPAGSPRPPPSFDQVRFQNLHIQYFSFGSCLQQAPRPHAQLHHYQSQENGLMHLFNNAPASPLMNPGPVSTQLQKLEDVLRRQGCFETPKGLEARREALKNLNILVSQWIQSASLSRGMHWQDVDKIGGRIVTYGSYMLGISHQGKIRSFADRFSSPKR